MYTYTQCHITTPVRLKNRNHIDMEGVFLVFTVQPPKEILEGGDSIRLELHGTSPSVTSDINEIDNVTKTAFIGLKRANNISMPLKTGSRRA